MKRGGGEGEERTCLAILMRDLRDLQATLPFFPGLTSSITFCRGKKRRRTFEPEDREKRQNGCCQGKRVMRSQVVLLDKIDTMLLGKSQMVDGWRRKAKRGGAGSRELAPNRFG